MMAYAAAATAETCWNDVLKEVFFNKQAIVLDVLPVQHVISELEKLEILSSNENMKLSGIVGEKDKCQKLMYLLNQSKNPKTFVHLFRAMKKCGHLCAELVNEIQRELGERDPDIFSQADLDEVSPANSEIIQVCGSSIVPDTTSITTSNDPTTEVLPSDVINIIVIGETGVGKSTWINALACYMTYETLDEAMRGNIVCPISTCFTAIDENFESKFIEYVAESHQSAGDVQIEQHSDPSRSGTQRPSSYVFCSHDKRLKVRIMDTPGMGHTCGSHEGEDLKHIALIMNHISRLDKLHGIVFLQKSNENKLTHWFKYCMEQLMENLHRDAIGNIIFCFTHSRSALYKPGETLTTLRAMLNEIKGVQFQLNKQTLYCLDNECVKFLIAYKKGIQFSEDEIEQFRKSWTFSVDESKRLLTAITRLKPLDTDMTVSVNAVRKAVRRLLSPFAKVIEVLQTNMIAVDELLKKIAENEAAGRINCTMELLQIRMETKKASPRTVCTQTNCECASICGLLGTKFQTYENPCHDNCRMPPWLAENRRGSKFLTLCEAFDWRGQCKRCKCSISDHMFITHIHEYRLEEVPLVIHDSDNDDDNVGDKLQPTAVCDGNASLLFGYTREAESNLLTTKENEEPKCAALEVDKVNSEARKLAKDRAFQQNKLKLEEGKNKLEISKQQQVQECTKIVNTAALFSYFLRKNAITFGKDEFLDCLDTIASDKVIEISSTALETRSTSLRQVYLQELQTVESNHLLSERARNLTTSGVSELFDELCRLPHVGKYMISISQALENDDENDYSTLEYTFNCKLPIGIEQLIPSVYQWLGFK